MRLTTVVSSRLFLMLVICILLITIVALLSEQNENCASSAAGQSSPKATDTATAAPPIAASVAPPEPSAAPLVSAAQEPDTSDWANHTLAVVVPFRDRFEEMLIFVPYMHRFLNYQKVRHRIYIVNQIDSFRFNRASLINVGFLRAREDGCDYMAMHDVDLLPLNRNLSYRYPGDALYHVASPDYHPRYHYPKFVGGILIIRIDHFAQVNGMSNNYWGWGLEDDEFYTRITGAKLKINRPANLTTTVKDTFRHIHDRRVRKRDMEKCYNQAAVTHRRDRLTGVHTVDYKILKTNNITIDGAPVQVLNVRLGCDLDRTPWCDCSGKAAAAEAAAAATDEDAKPPPPAPASVKTTAGRSAAEARQPDPAEAAPADAARGDKGKDKTAAEDPGAKPAAEPAKAQ